MGLLRFRVKVILKNEVEFAAANLLEKEFILYPRLLSLSLLGLMGIFASNALLADTPHSASKHLESKPPATSSAVKGDNHPLIHQRFTLGLNDLAFTVLKVGQDDRHGELALIRVDDVCQTPPDLYVKGVNDRNNKMPVYFSIQTKWLAQLTAISEPASGQPCFDEGAAALNNLGDIPPIEAFFIGHPAAVYQAAFKEYVK